MILLLRLFFVLTILFNSNCLGLTKNKCIKKDYGYGSVVCVCNSTYCDGFPEIPELQTGEYLLVTTTKAGERFNTTVGRFEESQIEIHIDGKRYSALGQDSDASVTIDTTKRFQTIFGFGGAFTDSTISNMLGLPSNATERLLDAYFSTNGIQYSMGRLPIASCDFSPRIYSYDDVENDFNLEHFQLTKEDTEGRIPVILRALKKSQKYGGLKLFASPWSAPAWMKTNNNMTGKGSLKGSAGGKYYKTWAQYFLRYIAAYQSHNISLWGITAQNEPTDGNIAFFFFQAMGWTPETQRDFIKEDLGPALKGSKYRNTKLMMLDDNRLWLPKWSKTVLSDKEASTYIDGIAVHWYMNSFVPAGELLDAHNAFPEKFLLSTEACAGMYPWQKHVKLGSWDRGADYAADIIENLDNYVTGWVDWNLALDPKGGPGWARNRVDSPVIVNKTSGEFYKQPMFYALGHFSRFLPHKADVKVGLSWNNKLKGVEAVAFVGKKNTVLVAHNANGESKSISVIDKQSQKTLPVTLKPYSFVTLMW